MSKASSNMKIAMPDGCNIHVESVGDRDPVIVFLHGIAMSGAVFKRQVAALSAEYRVVTVDLRGFGQSDRPETGYSEDVFVDDLNCILARLELKRPIIAGWSMGGARDARVHAKSRRQRPPSRPGLGPRSR